MIGIPAPCPQPEHLLTGGRGAPIQELRRAAFAIADELADQARLRPAAEAGLSFHVYDGAAGIALFLGACHSLSGEARWREVCLDTLAPLRRKLTGLAAQPEEAARLRLPLGGLVGIGGFLYAFTLLSRWLDDPGLLREARAAATLLTRERIAGDDRLDVMSGSAGAILALLVLDRELGDRGGDGAEQATPLELAVACGEHLLAARISHAGLPPAWPGPGGRPPLTGFSHGAAGISYALLRLFERTGRDQLRAAALAGVEFERRLYDAGAGTWLDPRSGRALEQSAWCHGAPGVALGRIGGLAVADDDAIRSEIDLALEITLAQPFSSRDHLCCGNLGRADVLLQAAEVLDRPAPSYRTEAGALAQRVVERAEEVGGFALDRVQLAGAPVSIVDPTLFRGLAGVGYGLLRLAEPGRLPCVLALA